ncbi:MAG: hypothetical protein NVS2B3_11420 [Vulcanimicrobiaceae bacterium]
MQIFASSYTDSETAQRCVDHVIGLERHQSKIEAWIDTGLRHPLVLEGTVPGTSVGIVLSRDGTDVGLGPQETNEAKVVLVAAPELPTAYTVHTTYPILRLAPYDLDVTHPGLFQLIGGYYHQDWAADYGGSPQAALDDYIALAMPNEVERTVAEIDRLVSFGRDDDALRRLLLRFDNNFPYAEHAGYTASMWLETIANRLRA